MKGSGNWNPPFRFRLSTLLFVIVIGGSVLGMYLRSKIGGVRYYACGRVHGTHLIEGRWRKEFGTNYKLVYLLCWPKGPSVGGLSSGNQVSPEEMGRGVARMPSGIFVDGVPVDVREGQRVWMYCWFGREKYTVKPILLTSAEIENLQPSDLDHLEDHPSWPEIKTMLDAQAQLHRSTLAEQWSREPSKRGDSSRVGQVDTPP